MGRLFVVVLKDEFSITSRSTPMHSPLLLYSSFPSLLAAEYSVEHEALFTVPKAHIRLMLPNRFALLL